ncbi:hypothetical protein [Paenibacillus polymyxa]|uniref:hypothetical protein n=1 Tax=Paenibacillus polymyxa TaxID=1406 RepID=UPI0027D92309|nr:hypothetical protein [Paenibacillus polymyxa]
MFLNSHVFELAKKLNTEENHKQWTGLRRNSVFYGLVCYINNSISLCLSDNYTSSILFLRRARKEIINIETNSNKSQYQYGDKYIKLCNNYLNELETFIKDNHLVSDEDFEFILNKELCRHRFKRVLKEASHNIIFKLRLLRSLGLRVGFRRGIAPLSS